MKKKLIGFMLTFTMMFSLFPGLSVMAKDECNESGTSDLGTIADLTEDENIFFTIKKGTLYLDVADMDGDDIYVMSVMPLSLIEMMYMTAEEYIAVTQLGMGSPVIDATALDLDADKSVIREALTDGYTLMLSTEELRPVVDADISEDSVVVVYKLNYNNMNMKTYASAAENPYTVEDATEAYVYAVSGIYSGVVEYQPKAVASVSGTVKDANGNSVKGADVVLLNYDNAEEVIAQTTTDANGKYFFKDLPDDFYILRIICDKMTAESIVTIEGDAVVNVGILSKGYVSSSVEVGYDTPAVTVDGLDEEAMAMAMSVMDEVHANPGETVEVAVTMIVEAKQDDVVDEDEKDAIKDAAASQKENLTFLNIEILKTVATNGGGSTEGITETENPLEIVIPFDTEGRKDFKVFRYNEELEDGHVQILTTEANADGEYIEVDENGITVHAKFFSTFAIAYSEDTGNRNTTTRAQLVTTLWRLEGKPMVESAEGFNDVYENDWYNDAVRWATANGIANGYGEGYFGPSDTVTREQTVSILWRYAQYKGIDVSVGEDTNILSYGDAFDVSGYAVPAMQWACGSDLVNGMKDLNGTMILDPQGYTTRAQMDIMMARFCGEV
ncbi:MAG: S-layer homology domain-containing protein [Anaerotignum sp.]|nr:S-layer homology domain-containing protein [Anaerotignum sp.]